MSDKGDTLQGALYLPADYEPGKKYPTVVYIYEKLSHSLHEFYAPDDTQRVQPEHLHESRATRCSMPDIVYKINDPGHVGGVVRRSPP